MMNTVKNLMCVKENILDMFQDIHDEAYSKGNMKKDKILNLSFLVESYVVKSKEYQHDTFIKDSLIMEKELKKLIESYKQLNEGFYNPFIDMYDDSSNDTIIEQPKVDNNSGIKISNVNLWNKNTKNKIEFLDGKMIAGRYFSTGDIIEQCPVDIISNKDLYSNTIRNLAFEIDKENGVYGLPLGYATKYRDSKSSGMKPNAEYVYHGSSSNPIIDIVSIDKIKKGSEIILKSDETDYDNELTPDRFQYPIKDTVMYAVKDFKFV